MRIPIETFRLENGLLVTLSEDHTAPIVAVNLWYHVGSANERTGRTGFAHLFEHMLFQGSAHVAANEHFELVQRAGGTLNGSTWLDRTNYFETLPSNQLALGLWLEADRMGALLPAMTQQKLDTQRDVVKNERRWSVDNQPYGTWWERLPALAYPPTHPFHHSLIGSMEDLTAASLEDVEHFFATYYTPDNAVLSIAGDFDLSEARKLVRRYFGPIPRGGRKPPLPDMLLPDRFGSWLRATVPDEVMLPRLFLAFRSPVFGSEEFYVASVASAILGVGKSSRLQRILVREREVASEATAFTFDLSKGADLLVLDVTGRPDMTGETIEAAVADLVDTVRSDGVSHDEVERAVALVETAFVTSMQSAGERADKLSMFATYFGDPSLVNEQVDRYRTVTAEQVTDFARARLGEDNRASLLYVPAKGARTAAAEMRTAAEVAS
jgi:zinc protease